MHSLLELPVNSFSGNLHMYIRKYLYPHMYIGIYTFLSKGISNMFLSF